MIKTNNALQKQISRQRAFDYCMYMMLTSYFGKSVCKSEYLEKKLFLNYQEQKVNDQIAMEEQCIRLIEKEILPKVPEKYVSESVDAHLQQSKDAVHTRVLIHTGDYILGVNTHYDKHKPQVFTCQWLKNAA